MTSLENKLEELLDKQEELCLKDNKKAASIHYEITKILEENGKELGPYKYYYRAKTYKLASDQLVNIDLREIAIDAYFRALIFQGNFEAKDNGKLLFETVSGIMNCYYGLNDKDLLPMMENDFNQKLANASSVYKNAWELLKIALNNKFKYTDSSSSLEKINNLSYEEKDELKKVVKKEWFYKLVEDLF